MTKPLTIEKFNQIMEEIVDKYPASSNTLTISMERAEQILAMTGGVLNKGKRRRILQRLKEHKPYVTEFPQGFRNYLDNTGRQRTDPS